MSRYHLSQLLFSTLQTPARLYKPSETHLYVSTKALLLPQNDRALNHIWQRTLTMLVPFLVADGDTIDENTFGRTKSHLSSYWSHTIRGKQNSVWLCEVKSKQLMLGNVLTAGLNEYDNNSACLKFSAVPYNPFFSSRYCFSFCSLFALYMVGPDAHSHPSISSAVIYKGPGF